MAAVGEKVADAMVKQGIDLLRVEAALKNNVVVRLNDMERKLVDKIKLLDPSAPVQLRYQLIRIENLVRDANISFGEAYTDIDNDLENDLTEIAHAESQNLLKIFGALFGIRLGLNALTRAESRNIVRQALIEGAQGTKWWRKQDDAARFDFERALREAIAAREDLGGILQRVRGTRAAGFNDGVIATIKRHAATLTRTAMTAAVNQARLATYRANSDIIKGVQWLSILDNRTSNICIALDGQAWDLAGNRLPGTVHPFIGPPPAHFNSLAEGTLITTDKGRIPIEEIEIGMFVLTHKGRFNKVSATMSKRNDTTFINCITTDTGRVLLATDEHPILVVSKGWQSVADIKIGDKLFEHLHKTSKARRGISGLSIPYNYPSLFNELPITYDVGAIACGGGMPITIDFKNNLLLEKSKINNGVSNWKLKCSMFTNKIKDCLLPPRRVFSQSSCQSGAHFFSGFRVMHGINFTHSLTALCMNSTRFFCFSMRPMIYSCQTRMANAAYRSRFLFASHRNSIAFKQTENLPGSKPCVFSNIAPRFIFDKISALQKFFGQHWDTPTVQKIVKLPYTSIVYNLSVEKDESYIAEGIIVHNCRSTLIPIMKSWNQMQKTSRRDVVKRLNDANLSRPVRTSFDGKGSTDMSYSEWLGKKDNKNPDFVKQILGPNRYKLWKDGDLALTDMIDQSWNPLTVEQLKQKISRRK